MAVTATRPSANSGVYDKDRALAGEYGPDVRRAFELSVSMMKRDSDENGTLSKPELDDRGEQANGEWSLAEGQDSTKLMENYAGTDGELSIDEIAQAYLGGVIITPSVGSFNVLGLGNGSIKLPVVMAAVVKGSDTIPGMGERETRILKAAYGTNGELSDEQLQQMVDDGVLARNGDKYKDINLGKMSAEHKARAFFAADTNGDGLMTAEEFHDGMDLILSKHARMKSLGLDDARTLVDAYGKDGLITWEQVKTAMDDGSFIVEGGRSPLRSGFSPDKTTLYATVNFDNLPAKQTAYMSKDENHSGGLDVKELGAFFDEREARILIAAYGEKGAVSEAQIKTMLDDGVIYRDGESLKNFNLGKLPADRQAPAFFAFDDNHDGVINAEELDKATDAIFLDTKFVDEQQARVLASAYGTDGLLNLDQVKAILKDGVITAKPAERRIRAGTQPVPGKLDGTLNLVNMPTEKLPGAFMAFDANHDGRLDAKELDTATDWISHGDHEMLTREEADKVVKAMADDGKALTQEEVKALADNKVFTTANGKLVYNERGISDYLLGSSETATPWAEDYFKYINDETLPGEKGTISDLAFQKVLEEYKDAPADSKKRKFYDLILAKYLSKEGWSNPDHYAQPLSGNDFTTNIFDTAKVDEEVSKLLQDTDFANGLSADLAKKTNDIIGEHFVMVDGKITLYDKNNAAHKNAPHVDGTAWAKSALAYTRTQEGRNEYKLGTPEQQQAFIKKYFGALSNLLPSDEVASALGEFGVMNSVEAIANTDLKDIGDEDLASALQIAGQYIMSARGPLNFIGNLSNMTKADWLSLAKALKAADGPLSAEAIINKLAPTDSPARQLVKSLGASGMWGTFAGIAGVAGAVIAYTADGPARDRLLAGDAREVLGLTQTISLVLSYSGSIVKSVTGGLGKFLSAVGYKDNVVEAFYNDFKKLPGFGGLVEHASAFQPSFSAVAGALDGVDLTDKAAVSAALSKVKDDTKRLWADIGYDFDKLADRIVDHARTFDTAGVYGPKVTSTKQFTTEERLGFLFDMTGVDTNYKNFVRANEILDTKDSKAPDIKVTDEDTLRQRLKAAGMSDGAIDRVVGELDVLSREGGPAATGNRKVMLDRFPDSKFVVTAKPPANTPVGQPLVESSVEKFINIGRGDGKLPPIKLERATAGLFVKSLGAAMDVIGGALGVATGIYDVVTGANSGDKLKIATGALGIASGVLGGLGGLAGFGALGSVAAGPLFIVAGILGIVSLILTIINGDKPVSQQFADSILDRFRDDGILKKDAQQYLESWFLNNTTDYEDSGIAS